VALVLMVAPGVAGACVLDNTASLWANGVRAGLTTAAPTDLVHWSPFTVGKAFAANTPVQLSEKQSDLARSLTPATLAAPYRWAFGDGSTALGHTSTHRYAHPGTYRIVVSGQGKGAQGWFTFDSVLVRIVPPDQVFQANLGFYALNALDFAVPGLLWLVDAGLVIGALYLVVLTWRGRRSAQRRVGAEVSGGRQ
jgi:hypothetical protein